MGAEVQYRVGAKVLADPAIESREGVGRRKTALEQQPHGVALIAHAGLHADEYVAELRSQNVERAIAAQLSSRCRSPLSLDLTQPRLPSHVCIDADLSVHVGVGATHAGITLDDALAQRIDALGYLDPIAALCHGAECAMQGFEYGQIGRSTGIAGIGREVEQHDGHPTRGPLAAPQIHQLRGARRQHLGALSVRVHVARSRGLGTIAATAEYDRAGATIQLRNRHHDRGFHWQQAALRFFPLFQCLEFHRVGHQVRYVEPRQHLARGLGIVVRGAADEREAGQRHHGIDGRPTILHEELLDGLAGIEAAGEGRQHTQTALLERGYDAVIVR